VMPYSLTDEIDALWKKVDALIERSN
jgi:hypothetical protein